MQPAAKMKFLFMLQVFSLVKEKREFELLGKEIAALGEEKEAVTKKLNNGNTPFEELQQLSLRIGEITQLLDEKEFRWLEISELQ